MRPVAVPAGDGDLEALSDVLQAAFFDDPVMSWILPDMGSRARRLAGLFSMLLSSQFLSMRATWTTSDQVGAALWAPPGHAKIPPGRLVRQMPTLLRVLGRHSPRALRFLDYLDGHHPAEPHWYLGFLGTSPAHQGKGVGSALISPVLERCDREGVPAFLESSKSANIPFYNRHGFEVTGELTFPGAPTMWPMWREPRAE